MQADRRQFLKMMGWTGAVAGLSAVSRFAQAAGPPASGAAAPPPDSSKAAAEAPKGPSDEARALAEALRKRFPHLTDAELATITSDLDDRLETSRALAKLSYGNGDEPDAVFRA
jgi:hypothetical protein